LITPESLSAGPRRLKLCQFYLPFLNAKLDRIADVGIGATATSANAKSRAA